MSKFPYPRHGSLASIVALILLIFGPAKQRRAAPWAALGLGVVAATLFVLASRHEPTLELRVYTDEGTLDVADFLDILSQGSLSVVMEPELMAELRSKGVRITTPPLRDVPLKYVLDEILTPQLPGPEQWTYEVVGMTVTIRRR